MKKKIILETSENRKIQEMIRTRAIQSYVIMLQPLLEKRYKQNGEESMKRLAYTFNRNYTSGLEII